MKRSAHKRTSATPRSGSSLKPSASAEPHGPALTPYILVVGAFLVRLLYLGTLRHHPWLHLPVVDELDFDRLARELIGQGSEQSVLPFFRPPLWPLLLSVVYRLFGTDFLYARLLNALLGALSVGSAWRLFARIFDRRTSTIAAALLALAGVLVHFEVSGLATSLFLLLSLEALIATLRFQDQPALARGIGAGLLWGLAILARPQAALTVSVLAVAILVFRRGRGNQLRKLVPSVAALAATVALVLAPVALPNLLHGGSLVAGNGGINFFLGNREGADGVAPVHPALGPAWTPEDASQWAEQQVGYTMTPRQVSAWYRDRGLEFWTTRPGKAFALFGKKLLLALGGVDLSNNGDLSYYAEQRPILRVLGLVGLWWIMPLGLVGMVLEWRRSNRAKLVVLAAAAYLAGTALFFVTTRYRAPAVVLMVPFAVEAVRALWHAHARSRKFVGLFASMLVALVVLNFGPAQMAPKPNRAYGLLLDGQLYARAGQAETAIGYFRAALREAPTTPLAHQSIGFLLLDAGKPEAAAAEFQAELDLHSQLSAYRGLALAYRDQGRHEAARDVLKRALALQPGNQQLRRMYAEEIGAMGLSAFGDGKLEEALELFRKAEEVEPENHFFAFGQASCFWAMQDSTRAAAIIDSLARIAPDYPPVRDWLQENWRP